MKPRRGKPAHAERAAALVQAAMADSHMDIRDLAEAAGLDEGTIGDFLLSKRWPHTSTIGKIAKALGLDAGDIIQAAHEVEVPTSRLDHKRLLDAVRHELPHMSDADLNALAADVHDERYQRARPSGVRFQAERPNG